MNLDQVLFLDLTVTQVLIALVGIFFVILGLRTLARSLAEAAQILIGWIIRLLILIFICGVIAVIGFGLTGN